MRSAIAAIAAVTMLLPATRTSTAQAQDAGLRVALSAGPAWLVRGGGYSATETAAHLQVAVGRAWGRASTLSLVLDGYAGEHAEATPDCLPAAPCETVTVHPGSLVGGGVELRHYLWLRTVAFAAGAGFYTGPSIKGFVAKSAFAGSLGVDVETGAAAGFGAVFGLRATTFSRNIAGVRLLVSPVLGVRF